MPSLHSVRFRALCSVHYQVSGLPTAACNSSSYALTPMYRWSLRPSWRECAQDSAEHYGQGGHCACCKLACIAHVTDTHGHLSRSNGGSSRIAAMSAGIWSSPSRPYRERQTCTCSCSRPGEHGDTHPYSLHQWHGMTAKQILIYGVRGCCRGPAVGQRLQVHKYERAHHCSSTLGWFTPVHSHLHAGYSNLVNQPQVNYVTASALPVVLLPVRYCCVLYAPMH